MRDSTRISIYPSDSIMKRIRGKGTWQKLSGSEGREGERRGKKVGRQSFGTPSPTAMLVVMWEKPGILRRVWALEIESVTHRCSILTWITELYIAIWVCDLVGATNYRLGAKQPAAPLHITLHSLHYTLNASLQTGSWSFSMKYLIWKQLNVMPRQGNFVETVIIANIRTHQQ